jgi:hypothetical protein
MLVHSLLADSYFFICPMSVVENVHVTVVGGNATFFCSGMRNESSRPYWWFKSFNSTEFELIYNGQEDALRYEKHFAVSNSTYLTLLNASLEFAGRYRCQEELNKGYQNEFELVILGKP